MKIRVIPSKYSISIKMATFFDAGASYTIITPNILLAEY